CFYCFFFYFFFFFFQAEDGIRDLIVTGVQTCALPISAGARNRSSGRRSGAPVPRLPINGRRGAAQPECAPATRRYQTAWSGNHRSEERRVGKECRSRWLR